MVNGEFIPSLYHHYDNDWQMINQWNLVKFMLKFITKTVLPIQYKQGSQIDSQSLEFAENSYLSKVFNMNQSYMENLIWTSAFHDIDTFKICFLLDVFLWNR